MRYAILASGSSGNAMLVEAGGRLLLIDAGISARQIARGIEALGMRLDCLEAIVITHEHIDHVGGLRVLAGKLCCPIYASAGTWAGYQRLGRWADGGEVGQRRELCVRLGQAVVPGAALEAGPFNLATYPLPHDADEHMGLRVTAGGVTLGLATDLGHISAETAAWLADTDALCVESNHCPDLLVSCPLYSWPLKQRIGGDYGHLSNRALAAWIGDRMTSRTRQMTLMHLSEKTNTPGVALDVARVALEGKGLAPFLRAAGPKGFVGWSAVY